ncbi:MAG: SBBP repeat-containing protein, partial [Planctomycetaceae bacterium]|nr:SBBP repeat-containing protein [Planctomycetaceae bacterium]
MSWRTWWNSLLGRIWEWTKANSVATPPSFLHVEELERRVFMSASPLGIFVPDADVLGADNANLDLNDPIWAWHPDGSEASARSVDSAASNDLLSFTAASGEIVAFDDTSYFVGSLDRLLNVEFVGASVVDPVSRHNFSGESLLDASSENYQNVFYADLWSGIDAVFESDVGTLLKSTYYVDAGVSVDQIHLEYNQDLSLDVHGNLVMNFERGTMTESAPIAWQDINGVRHYVDVAFRLIDNDEVGFVVGDYDLNYQLVIDPTLTWHSFVGGSGTDYVYDIAIDSSGNVYVSGASSATWGTPVRAFVSGEDGFVAKFNSTGTLLWNTFLGGNGSFDHATAITVDGSGNTFVTGFSNATWGTPVTAYGGGDFDAFVAKVDTSGVLQWNTFAGGSGIDAAYGIVLDSSGNSYIAGNSNTTWGTPVRAYSSAEDGFIAKLSSTGSLTWNTFVGGTGNDRADDLAIDASNNVYGAGYSNATWGSAVRSYSSGQDAIAFKLDSSGALTWNTFLGGSGTDYLGKIAIDSSGNSYLSGNSNATWGTPVTAYSSAADALVVKLNSSGTLTWNTFLGGSGTDVARGIGIDSYGNVHVAGYSTASWGTPWQAYNSGTDAWVTQLSGSGATSAIGYLGGSGTDIVLGMALDSSGDIYVGGYSSATWGSPVRSYQSGTDGWVAKVAALTSVVRNTNDSGAGSLRQAITDANAIAGTDTIQFNIATSDASYNRDGLGTFVIQPTSALPTITEAVILDATTQSQYVSSPVIEIDGSNAGVNANGFSIGSTGGGSTIKGFAINGFASGSGILVTTGGLNNIEGNYIGIRPTGSDAFESAVGWWKGDADLDDAVGPNNGTLVNGATYGTGKVGQGFSFDGFDDYVQLGSSSIFKMTNAFTLEAWINPTGAGSGDAIIFNREGEYEIARNSGTGEIRWAVSNTSNLWTWVGTGYIAPLNTWTHLSITFDNGTVRVYANGALVHTGSISSSTIGDNSPAQNDLRLGGRQAHASGANFQGIIDEAAVYSRTLTATEIAASYNLGLAAKSAAKVSIVSQWQAEGDATDARSLNNGTLTNGATITNSTNGKLGSAFSFDGTDDYVSLADSSSFGSTGMMTVSAWINPDILDAVDPRDIVGQWNASSSQRAFVMQQATNGKLSFFISRDGALDYTSVQSTASLKAGVWQHVVGTYDGANLRVYINGMLQGTSAAFAGTMFDSNTTLRIGDSQASGSVPFDGRIDEVQLVNRALSDSDIANLYANQSRDANTFVATPIASYKAEGNANDFDGTNEGSLINGATFSSGVTGQGFFLDGVNDYIQIPDASALDFTTAMTLGTWINPTTVSNARIFDKITSGGVDGYLLDIVGGKLRLQLGGTSVTGATTINAGEWIHVAGVYDGTSIKVYVNGALDTSANYSGGVPVNALNMRLGADSNGTSLFSGRIDEAVAYNRALSVSEIATLVASVSQSTIGNQTGITLT